MQGLVTAGDETATIFLQKFVKNGDRRRIFGCCQGFADVL
jgi:hypothetical protein